MANKAASDSEADAPTADNTNMKSATKSGFGRARPRATAARSPLAERGSSGQAQLFRIAGVQMASGPNVAANLNEAKRLIEMAVEQGAKLVALPE